LPNGTPKKRVLTVVNKTILELAQLAREYGYDLLMTEDHPDCVGFAELVKLLHEDLLADAEVPPRQVRVCLGCLALAKDTFITRAAGLVDLLTLARTVIEEEKEKRT
jgi:hypothetical protein